ncbi:MAG: hypothetical protein N2645_19950 [Clostridia bacterium]|nr:hypothetical protein [Clostridia bacterium]
MKISDEAKLLITDALASNNCDCLQVVLKKSCCGTSLNFVPIKLKAGDSAVSIDGISVMMDDQVKARVEKVTLAVEDGELIIQDDAPSCCG